MISFGLEEPNIIKYTGQRVEDSDSKFGKVAYYYDKIKSQWMGDYDIGYKQGVYPAKSKFYTLSGFPVFAGIGRWKTNIVALSADKFLIVNIGSDGDFTAL